MRSMLQRFAHSEQGSTAMVFGLLVIPLCGFIGLAVDGARWHNAKQVTAEAVDSAVLVAARKIQLDPGNAAAALASARSTYLANTANRAPTTLDTVDFVKAVGQAKMQSAFLTVIGINDMPIFSESGAKASFASGLNAGSNIEVSLVLDFTGSMCDNGQSACTSGTKVQGLRDAATELVNIVVNDNQSNFTSKVALVPFSSRIRVDSDNHDGTMMKALTNLDPTWSGWVQECTNWVAGNPGVGENSGGGSCTASAAREKTNWKLYPCVTERLYGTNWDGSATVDYTDRAPGPGRWLNAHGGNRLHLSEDSSENLGVSAGYGESASNPSYNWNYGPSAWCYEAPEENAIVPLSSDKVMLRNKIANFSAGGSTAGALATSFGWYMLSPNWSSIWPASARPGTYSDVTARQQNGAPVLRKIAIIMTDGVYNTMRGVSDRDQKLVTDHAEETCKAMKDKGIEIYTVGFALDQLSGNEKSRAENMLKKCGTSVHHFYSTLNVDQLKTAFRDIGLKATPIRLTQ
jgi:Flp pilus assembly protein TadG